MDRSHSLEMGSLMNMRQEQRLTPDSYIEGQAYTN
jgi:hypothetical protein